MKREYLTFAGSLKDLLGKPEVVLVIKDLTDGPEKYNARYVKARISDSPERSPDSDTLWVRSPTGMLYPGPLGIAIIQELGESPK
jgi:hypothetical protein